MHVFWKLFEHFFVFLPWFSYLFSFLYAPLLLPHALSFCSPFLPLSYSFSSVPCSAIFVTQSSSLFWSVFHSFISSTFLFNVRTSTIMHSGLKELWSSLKVMMMIMMFMAVTMTNMVMNFELKEASEVNVRDAELHN
jgi:hypothetical protein